jgi:uncharacterized membrane protein
MWWYRGPDWHAPWWGPLYGIVPLALLLLLLGLVVWAIVRVSRQPQVATPWTQPPQSAARPDPALEHARMRYARGEIDRDEYVRLVGDLGGSPIPPPAPPQQREAGG